MMVPGSIPNMVSGFCKEQIIFTSYAAKQKYQNFSQLLSGSLIICLAGLFYLQADHKSAAVGWLMGNDQDLFIF